jgi:hypothetical protein
MTTEQLVRVELNRGRVSLGRVVPGLKPGDLFRVTLKKDGTVILKPVRVVERGPGGDEE